MMRRAQPRTARVPRDPRVLRARRGLAVRTRAHNGAVARQRAAGLRGYDGVQGGTAKYQAVGRGGGKNAGRCQVECGTTSISSTSVVGRAVVLDGVSIGGGTIQAVNVPSLLSALRYYTERRANAVVLIPEDAVISSGADRKTLHLLTVHGKIVRTPGGLSHYPFLLRAVQLRGADLVTNTNFEFILAAQRRAEDRTCAAQYLRTHLVPFRFVLGSFVPQPDARAIVFGLHGPRVAPAVRGGYANQPQLQLRARK